MAQGDWGMQRAYEQAQQLLVRYPQTRLIWSANDQMAFGAMRAVEEAGGKPGETVLFSALNNSSDVLQGALSKGAAGALERVAQFYLDMAEGMFPVIEVDAGRQVELIMTKGAELRLYERTSRGRG